MKTERLSDDRLEDLLARSEVWPIPAFDHGEVRDALEELIARRAKDADLRALIESQVASAQGCGDTCPARNDPDCRALDNAAFVDDEDEETRRCRAALLAHFGLPEVPRE